MADGNRVAVWLRVRPPLPRELLEDDVVQVTQNTVEVNRDGTLLETRVDQVFSQEASQADIYEKAAVCVDSILAGYNATIMAYGQTGTGKTYTMMGGNFLGSPEQQSTNRDDWDVPTAVDSTSELRGIIPRTVEELFGRLQDEGDGSFDEDGGQAIVSCSYMEIYNEKIYDLLQPYKNMKGVRDPRDVNRRKQGLEIREDATRGTFVMDLTVARVESTAQVLQLLARGHKSRSVRQTEMNENSSRSHTILQLTVVRRFATTDGRGNLVVSKLNLVDLAGSERWAGDVPGVEPGSGRLKETTAINTSLSALTTVVMAVASRNRTHIPFRDSKLTHLLQDSLGGNCKTVIITTVSPAAGAADETASTLQFAARAKCVQTKATVNSIVDDGMRLERAEREVQRLREALAEMLQNQPSADGAPPPMADGMEVQLRSRIAALETDNRRVTSRLAAAEQALRAEKSQRVSLQRALAARSAEATREGEGDDRGGRGSGPPGESGWGNDERNKELARWVDAGGISVLEAIRLSQRVVPGSSNSAGGPAPRRSAQTLSAPFDTGGPYGGGNGGGLSSEPRRQQPGRDQAQVSASAPPPPQAQRSKPSVSPYGPAPPMPARPRSGSAQRAKSRAAEPRNPHDMTETERLRLVVEAESRARGDHLRGSDSMESGPLRLSSNGNGGGGGGGGGRPRGSSPTSSSGSVGSSQWGRSSVAGGGGGAAPLQRGQASAAEAYLRKSGAAGQQQAKRGPAPDDLASWIYILGTGGTTAKARALSELSRMEGAGGLGVAAATAELLAAKTPAEIDALAQEMRRQQQAAQLQQHRGGGGGNGAANGAGGGGGGGEAGWGLSSVANGAPPAAPAPAAGGGGGGWGRSSLMGASPPVTVPTTVGASAGAGGDSRGGSGGSAYSSGYASAQGSLSAEAADPSSTPASASPPQPPKQRPSFADRLREHAARAEERESVREHAGQAGEADDLAALERQLADADALLAAFQRLGPDGLEPAGADAGG